MRKHGSRDNFARHRQSGKLKHGGFAYTDMALREHTGPKSVFSQSLKRAAGNPQAQFAFDNVQRGTDVVLSMLRNSPA